MPKRPRYSSKIDTSGKITPRLTGQSEKKGGERNVTPIETPPPGGQHKNEEKALLL